MLRPGTEPKRSDEESTWFHVVLHTIPFTLSLLSSSSPCAQADYTFLHVATVGHRLDLVRSLLDRKADLNAKVLARVSWLLGLLGLLGYALPAV